MKFKNEPLLGKMNQYELFITKVTVTAHTDEYPILLETGFLPDERISTFNKLIWIPTRSVRINLHNFIPSKTQRKIFKNGITYQVSKLNKDILLPLYNEYKQINNYSSQVDEIFLNYSDHNVIYYSYDNKLIGFCVIRKLNGGMISFQFATTNYTKLSVGTFSQIAEIEIAKADGYKYLYIGAGYESCCKYKSSFSGFEFWDGCIWNTDKELYNTLCDRDDSINNLEDLSKLFL